MTTSEANRHKRRYESPADRSRERESVNRIINILWHNFPFIASIAETDKWSVEDKNGIDLVLSLRSQAADTFGFAQINIQAKSSESMIETFFENGKQIEKQYGHNWRDTKLIILNGQADEQFIIADFLAQLINLLEALDQNAAIDELISWLGEEVYEIYEDAVYPEQVETIMQDTYQALRGPILAWVKQLSEE